MSLLAICKIVGHNWKYKDYTSCINHKGEKYLFTDKRICRRCDKREYKIEKWLEEKSMPASAVETF
jgi:hypothetical protein